jgi:Xaa-Pro aminopeptidase
MKYDKIDNALYIDNRKRYTSRMKPKSLAIFYSNDIYPISGDSAMPFQQHRDILHLSGVDQEESILVIFPDAVDEKDREILFLTETSDLIAVWYGKKLNKEEAYEVSGIKSVYWLDEFDTVMKRLMSQAENVYLNANEHLRANTEVETRENRFNKKLREQYPIHNYERSAPIMHYIRSIKNPIELELMQHACDITEKGFRRLLSFIKPGVWEYELEAEVVD